MYVAGENALDACTRESLQTDRDIVGCNCFVPASKKVFKMPTLSFDDIFRD